ncbi:MAG TPA: S-adenosylmethionine:tRNA ribosyltransferase-isomerase [Myxococcales bacterium]|nr:S-adenosylmethionine:tRNA ribosyltransferase-isomerase [Myxococcales bacterium]
MKPATWPRDDALRERLLHLDLASGTLRDARIADLPALLREGDVLVVNDAATLPASLQGRTDQGAPIEARLVGELPGGAFRAVLFGQGDWRTPTEHRPPPPALGPGDRLSFGELSAAVLRSSPVSPRLVELRFEQPRDQLWPLLYRLGRPVQYSYAKAPVEAWHVQVPYASQPWAAEMPSAGRPLRWEVLLEARRRGVAVASITHAAGLSSTGDPILDAALPLPERFAVPAATADAVARAHAAGGRVLAVGTTVVRALEGAALRNGGRLAASAGETDLVVGPGYRPAVVDGLLTGVHEKGASHYALLHAFAPAGLLERAHEHSERGGYLTHEFGDSWLLL